MGKIDSWIVGEYNHFVMLKSKNIHATITVPQTEVLYCGVSFQHNSTQEKPDTMPYGIHAGFSYVTTRDGGAISASPEKLGLTKRALMQIPRSVQPADNEGPHKGLFNLEMEAADKAI